jgi:hypothetical protein
MGGVLLFEVRMAAGGDWVTLGTLTPETLEGSVTDITGGGRDILLFRCDGARSVVSRLADPPAFDAGPLRAVRLPITGREILADLGDGHSYELDVISEKRRGYRARWTHRGGGE